MRTDEDTFEAIAGLSEAAKKYQETHEALLKLTVEYQKQELYLMSLGERINDARHAMMKARDDLLELTGVPQERRYASYYPVPVAPAEDDVIRKV